LSDIITSADYDSVRGLLGVTSQQLPTTTLDLLPFHPAAELQIKGWVPNWATLVGDDLIHLKLAVVAQTAINAMAQTATSTYESEQFGDYRYSRGKSALSIEEKRASLLAQVASEIGAISGFASPPPVGMQLASPYDTATADRDGGAAFIRRWWG